MPLTPFSVYVHREFWFLVGATLLLPAAIFFWLAWRRRISRLTIGILAIALVGLAGVDAILLQRLRAIAVNSASMGDDRLFASEFSLALYVIPLVTAGMGVNLLSHLLHQHLIIAELEHDRKKRLDEGDDLD